ncbi:hypothetical protein IQ06DRAFT_152665 [Phaeosphaeriaceae sp. SRC1lsM3a]|nr:hypothetical protein IQ06DRAFT_152665 [Stagonospora sp. SRC1lsM3a]
MDRPICETFNGMNMFCFAHRVRGSDSSLLFHQTRHTELHTKGISRQQSRPISPWLGRGSETIKLRLYSPYRYLYLAAARYAITQQGWPLKMPRISPPTHAPIPSRLGQSPEHMMAFQHICIVSMRQLATICRSDAYAFTNFCIQPPFLLLGCSHI